MTRNVKWSLALCCGLALAGVCWWGVTMGWDFTDLVSLLGFGAFVLSAALSGLSVAQGQVARMLVPAAVLQFVFFAWVCAQVWGISGFDFGFGRLSVQTRILHMTPFLFFGIVLPMVIVGLVLKAEPCGSENRSSVECR